MIARRGLMTAMATLAICLVAAVALKAPCVFEPWVDDFQHRAYCHSDVVASWDARGLDTDTVPYLEAFNEDAPITAFTMWFTAAVTDTLAGYVFVTVMILIAAAYGATLAVWRAGGGLPKILALSASAALIAHAMTNWDLLAVAMAAIGWMRWREGDAWQAALFFGLGGATKLYPALFLPFILLAAWRQHDTVRVKRVVAGGAVGLIVPNLIVMAFAFDGWLAMWRHVLIDRAAIETPWWIATRLGLEPAVAHLVAPLAVLAVVGVLAHRVWTRGLHPLVAGAVAVFALLVVTPVYAPQATLWILPWLVLLDVPWGRILAFTAADVAVFLVRHPYLATSEEDSEGAMDGPWEPWLMVAVVARWAALAAVLWWAGKTYACGPLAQDASSDQGGSRQDIWPQAHPDS